MRHKGVPAFFEWEANTFVPGEGQHFSCVTPEK